MAQRAQQIASHLNYPQGMLAGQTAIITGSGQGIGAEAARLFANEGCKVVVCDVDSKKAEDVAKSINAASPNRAIAVAGDVTDKTYLEVLVKKAAEFGGGEIHYLVNNAGYTWDGVIHKITDKQWDTMLAVHNTAPFQLVRAAAPYFRVKDGKPRCIINISSTSGTHGNAGQANYSLAKAGVTGLTKTIAKEWGPQFGVRANTIAFGHINTRLTAAKEAGAFITTPDGQRVALGIPDAQLQARKGAAGAATPQFQDIPLGRPGTATEAASSILAICSPLFAYVNGQTIEAQEQMTHVEHYEHQLEEFLPASFLRKPDSTEIQKPIDQAKLITVLSNAQSDRRGPVNLLSRLVLVHNRPNAALFFINQLLDYVAARNSDTVQSPPSALAWPKGLSADELLQPVELQRPQNHISSLSHSLEHQYANLPHGGASGLTEVWQFLAYLIVEASNITSGDATPVMSLVHQTLAQLHHRGLVPDNIYDWAISPFSSVAPRAPILHLLSSRILSTLSDATWRSHQDEAIARDEQLGISYQKTQDPPGGRFRLKVRELGPEAWLEFVLWCCVESNCPQAGANIVSLLAEQPSAPWRASSWKSNEEQDLGIKIDWDRVQSRTGGAVGRIEGYSHDNPLAEIPARTISAEVILALIEASIDAVYASDATYTQSCATLPTTVQRFLAFLQPHHLPKEYVEYISARSFVGMAPSALEQRQGLLSVAETVSTVRALSTSGTIMSSAPTGMDFCSIVQQSQLHAGLLQMSMHACCCQGEVRRAIDAFDQIQEMVDQSKMQAIASFLALPPGSGHQKTPSASNKDFIMSHGQLPLFRIAAFLDILTDNNVASLSDWLIYSTDVDGPLMPTSAFQRPSVASALIRYAGANHDLELVQYVMTAIRSRKLKPAVTVLRLEANAHMQCFEFTSAAACLEALKPAIAGGFHPDNLACLAVCILRLEAGSHPKGRRRTEVHLASAVALMRDLLQGHPAPTIMLESTSFQDFISFSSPAQSTTEFIDENFACTKEQRHNPVVTPTLRSLMIIVNKAIREASATDGHSWARRAQQASSLLRSSWVKDRFQTFNLEDEYKDLLMTIGEAFLNGGAGASSDVKKYRKLKDAILLICDQFLSSKERSGTAAVDQSWASAVKVFGSSGGQKGPEDSLAAADLPVNTQRAIVAGGCFWGTEELYRKHWKDKGLVDCRVGYTGGHTDEPTYYDVCSGRTGHAESLLIAFDPDKVTYRQLIEFFFKMHDPTTLNRQGADTGTQYRSAIFVENDEQEKIANEIKDKVGKEWYKGKPITTEIKKATKWWDAELMHQDYIHVQLAEGNIPYQCPAHFVRPFPPLSE
ncbi:hypothetical protein DV737_g3928, partial [Chaetothyriales sp. CBS 132003]